MKNLIGTLALMVLTACNESIQISSSITPSDTSPSVTSSPTSGATATPDPMPVVSSPVESPMPISTPATIQNTITPTPTSTPSTTPLASPSPSPSPTPSPSPSYAHFAYAINQGDSNVISYGIDASGALKSIGQTSTSSSPTDAILDPTKKFLYVLGSQVVSEYAIQANGTLNAVGSIAVNVPSQHLSLGIDNNLYIEVNSNSTNQYTVDSPSGLPIFANFITPYASYVNLNFKGHTSSVLGGSTYQINTLANSVDQIQNQVVITRTITGHTPSAIVLK